MPLAFFVTLSRLSTQHGTKAPRVETAGRFIVEWHPEQSWAPSKHADRLSQNTRPKRSRNRSNSNKRTWTKTPRSSWRVPRRPRRPTLEAIREPGDRTDPENLDVTSRFLICSDKATTYYAMPLINTVETPDGHRTSTPIEY